MSQASKLVCFVIMPFSDTATHDKTYWKEHFDQFLKPLIEEIPELVAVRSQALRGDILKEIITQLVTAPVVVADLTDAKPNVYWELGVRQSFKHGTVTIQEGEVSLPFDLGAKGTLPYTNTDRIKQSDFSRKFKAAIHDCLVHPERTDSHVLEAISGRGTLFETFRRDETIRRLDALESEFAWNSLLLKKVGELASDNRSKKPEERTMSSARLRTLALELLITNRYVDESAEFYLRAELYHDTAIKMNESLSDWRGDTHYVDQWLMENVPNSDAQLARFKELVIITRKKTLSLA